MADEFDGFNYGQNITLPAEVAMVYFWSFPVLTVFTTSLLLYITLCSKLPEDLYRCLALQHLLSSYLHIACITIYNLNFPIPYLDDILEEPYSCMDLVITFTTACLSWIIFLRVFMFRNGEKLYNMKELTIFSSLSLAIIEGYEYLISFIDLEFNMVSALRMTSVLLLMALPIAVFFLLMKSLFSSTTEVPKFQAVFFMTYLLFFITSDILLFRFNLYSVSIWTRLWSILLSLRLVIEILWYIICDRYLSNFLIC